MPPPPEKEFEHSLEDYFYLLGTVVVVGSFLFITALVIREYHISPGNGNFAVYV